MKLIIALMFLTTVAVAQELPARWDELVASDWPNALARSDSTCILPIGILEKHGPHAPMGCDLIYVRELAARVTASLGRYLLFDPRRHNFRGKRRTHVISSCLWMLNVIPMGPLRAYYLLSSLRKGGCRPWPPQPAPAAHG